MQTVSYNDLKNGTIYLCLCKNGECYYIVYSIIGAGKYGQKVNRNGELIEADIICSENKFPYIQLWKSSQYYAINSEYERTFNQVQNANATD